MNPHFEKCFAKFSTQNVHYKMRGAKEKGPNLYPWLDKDDPRRHMTDEEILYKHIDLSESHLTESEKEEVMNLIIDNKKALLNMNRCSLMIIILPTSLHLDQRNLQSSLQ